VLRPVEGHGWVAPVLASIALAEAVPGTPDPYDPAATIGLDGSFRIGPIDGRASKPVAQFVGASARAAERARRIEQLAAQLAEQTSELTHLESEHAAATQAVRDLDQWLAAIPSPAEVTLARSRRDDARLRLVRAEAEAHTASRAAVAARSHAAKVRQELMEFAARHGLPAEEAALADARADLRDLLRELGAHLAGLAGLIERTHSVDAASGRVEEARTASTEAIQAGEAATALNRARMSAYHALSESLSDTIGELQARRAAARHTRDAAQTRLSELQDDLATSRGHLGGAEVRAAEADRLLVQREGAVLSTSRALAQLRAVPGLLDAALDDMTQEVERALAAFPSGESSDSDTTAEAARVAALGALAREWASVGQGEPDADENAVLKQINDLRSGAAASHEPALRRVGDTLAALARDDSREVTLAGLAAILATRAAEQRQLLTRRERDAFEQVLLGSLGDELRRRLQEAHELVEGMNEVLHGVRTSLGVQVRLRWRLRDDTPPEARDVTDLVARSSVALLPDERDRLHEAMSQLLALAADDAPDDGYAEHLRRALDYRSWHEFRVQYTRPGWDKWEDLSRRSPLSQGEQKVACYLPLFAAAAAHFTSVAGAAPHAPRFVLLDDAFPKIDARTHPLLFGLLVRLDLDFVVTSERLWGDHPEVPSLAIYEALRSPGEPGIAQARYTWDGRALQSVGVA
jgi:hypothetical protein